MERLYKIVNLSRPAIYIIVTVLLLAPLVRPLGLPVPISDATRNYKAAIDSMSPGDIMWILSGLNVEMGVELMPGMTATANYAYNRGIKIVLTAPTPAGYEFAKQIVADLQSKGAVYGEDIVNFGYIPGEEAAIAALLSDFHRAAPTDSNGTPVGTIPLMKRVKSGADIQMAVVVTGDASAPDMYTRQFQPFPNCMLTFSSQGTLWPKIQTYLPTGQVKLLQGPSEEPAQQRAQLLQQVRPVHHDGRLGYRLHRQPVGEHSAYYRAAAAYLRGVDPSNPRVLIA